MKDYSDVYLPLQMLDLYHMVINILSIILKGNK